MVTGLDSFSFKMRRPGSSVLGTDRHSSAKVVLGGELLCREIADTMMLHSFQRLTSACQGASLSHDECLFRPLFEVTDTLGTLGDGHLAISIV